MLVGNCRSLIIRRENLSYASYIVKIFSLPTVLIKTFFLIIYFHFCNSGRNIFFPQKSLIKESKKKSAA